MIQKYGKQKRLLENQRYTITFSLQGETQTFSFTSRYSPLYSTVKILRNDFPDLFEGFTDDALHFAIWQASILAQQIALEDQFTDGKPSFAVKQYVRYKSEHDLIRSILISLGAQAGIAEKHLGEFKITKEMKTPELEKILAALKEEIRKWENAMGSVIRNRGAVRAGQSAPYPLNARVSF
jgi:hypothetical protein